MSVGKVIILLILILFMITTLFFNKDIIRFYLSRGTYKYRSIFIYNYFKEYGEQEAKKNLLNEEGSFFRFHRTMFYWMSFVAFITFMIFLFDMK